MNLKKVINIAIVICSTSLLSAAMSQEPVVITKCKNFSARSDDQSKIVIASQYRNQEVQCQNAGDCDDINKVCANKIIDVKFHKESFGADFKLEAIYPDGKSYFYYISIKAPKNPYSETAEFWASSTENIEKSTYAIAIKDSEKNGFLEIFRLAKDENEIAEEILKKLGTDLDKKLNPAQKISAQKVELELVKIFEAITGIIDGGYTAEFVDSNDWFNDSLRKEKLNTLKDIYEKKYSEGFFDWLFSWF